MKILGLSLVAAALVATGCAADHNDAVQPGYYDGHHIPSYPAYYGIKTAGDIEPAITVTNVSSAPLDDADDTSD